MPQTSSKIAKNFQKHLATLGATTKSPFRDLMIDSN